MKQGWEYKKLGELGRVITGSTPSTKDVKNYETNDVCFIKPSDISGNGIDYLKNSEYYISEYAYNNSRQLPKGSVLTTCIGIIGKVAILEIDATCNQQINAIVPNNDIDSKFLAYSIISQRYLMQSMANAPVVPLLNKTQFSGFQIPVPSLTTQQSIVSELDTLSQIIADYKEQLADYDKLEQSIFYDMFGDPVKNEKGWEVKKLGEVSEIIGGSTPKTNIGEYWNGIYKWITPAELKGEKYIKDTERKISVLAIRSTNLQLLPCGTVLLSSRAPIGKVAITKTEMYCNQGFKNIVCSSSLDKEYVYMWLYLQKDYLNSLGTGATFKEISKKTVVNLDIPVPPLPLQQQFASKIESIEQMKADTKAALQDAELLFQSRMDYWFN